jgi:hypothetical protein
MKSHRLGSTGRRRRRSRRRDCAHHPLRNPTPPGVGLAALAITPDPRYQKFSSFQRTYARNASARTATGVYEVQMGSSAVGRAAGPGRVARHLIEKSRIQPHGMRKVSPGWVTGPRVNLASLGVREVGGQVGGSPGQEPTRDPETDGGSDDGCCADDSG